MGLQLPFRVYCVRTVSGLHNASLVLLLHPVLFQYFSASIAVLNRGFTFCFWVSLDDICSSL